MAEGSPRTGGISLATTWGALAMLIPAAVTAAVPTQALDLAYQLRAGSEMLRDLEIMRADSFTFTVYGASWLNQQWGAQVLLTAVHPGDAWLGLALLRVSAVAGTMLLIYRSCRSAGAAARPAAALTLGGWFVGAVTMAQLRPQTFGIVLFALTGWLVTTRSRGADRLWVVPLIALAWVNLHGSFPLVIVWLVLAAVDEWSSGRRDQLTRILGVAALSLVAMLVNPFGIGVVSYVVDLASDPVVSERIGEWGSPSLRSLTGASFWVSLLVVALVVARRRARVPIGSLVGLAIFGLLSIVAVRGVVWWALAVPILLAPAFGRVDHGSAGETTDRSLVGVALVATVLVATLVGVVRGVRVDPATGSPAMLTFAPGRLTDALRETQPHGGRVFASQLLASWAEYAAPEHRYAVDSRIELFPAPVWNEYFAISDAAPGWEAALDRAEVDAVLLDPSQAAGLLREIRASSHWRLVLETPDGAVFVRSCTQAQDGGGGCR